MARPRQRWFIFVLMSVLVLAVLALAIAQSAHLQPALPAVVMVAALLDLLLQQRSTPSRSQIAPLPAQSLPYGFVRPHFPMPPPSFVAA